MESSVQGKQVLVTGADGFIGSHLCERLVREGARVHALALYNSFGTAGWLDRLAPEIRSEIQVSMGDVRDARRVADVMRGSSVVFHLAALIAIPYSYQAPQSYLDTNVTGTLNVLDAALQHGLLVVHTSTSEVYGSPEQVPITESHPLKGQSPYAASKIAADKFVESYSRSFELPTVTVRPFNTYGPRQSDRAVIPTILSQLISGCESLRLGALWPRRDLTYVTDTVDGFVRAATHEAAIGQTIQLGTGADWSIGELATVAMRIVGREVPVIVDDVRQRPKASEVVQLLSDPTHAGATLGWRPTVELEEGLRRTADWIGSNIQFFRPDVYAT